MKKKNSVTDEVTLSVLSADRMYFPDDRKYDRSVYEVREERKKRMLSSAAFRKKVLKAVYDCHGIAECDTFLTKVQDRSFDILWEKFLSEEPLSLKI